MARVRGCIGRVFVDTNECIQTRSWEFTEGGEELEAGEIGNCQNEYEAGATEVTGTCEVNSGLLGASPDPAHAAIVRGAAVTIEVRPEGTGSGNSQRSFAATILEVSESGAKDGYWTMRFNWRSPSVDRTAQA